MTEPDVSAPTPGRGEEPRTRHHRAAITTNPAMDWVRLGGILMVVIGAFSVIEGVLALAAPDTYITVRGTVLGVTITAWAWIHVVLGALVFLIGLGLLRDTVSQTARLAGITLVGLAVVIQLLWLPAAPIWSILMICVDVVVLRALIVTEEQDPAGRW
jgi:hypothetical protein